MSAELVLKSDEERALAMAAFEADKDQGLENADSDCYAIPYLTVLQKLSPQCDKRDSKFVEGAEAGSLFNTVTQEIFSGDSGALIVPVTFVRAFTEWVPRDEGGGFRGMHEPSSSIVIRAKSGGPSGRLVAENGNHLADTRYHFCLLVTPTSTTQVVLSLASTQLKKSKQWMTQMNGIRIRGETGTFRPPSFSQLWRATTSQESNDQGSWFGWKIQRERSLDLRDEADAEIYATAKEFRAQVISGRAKAGSPVEETTVDSEM